MIKVLSIFGTRPEAIKIGPILKQFEKYPSRFTSVVCVTAQHRDMLDQVLNLFDIIPHYDLNLMAEDQDLYQLTTRILRRSKDVLSEVKPDMVLVQGDTTTTFSGALAAFYNRTPVGHVEAGLRSWDKYNPYPEEINRAVTSVLADLHFAPTDLAKENLLRCGIKESCIHVTGNTVIDALFYALKKVGDSPSALVDLDNVDWKKRFILVTAHRRESFGKSMEQICKAIGAMGCRFSDFNIIFPVHPNPNVQRPVHSILSAIPNVFLINPLDYLSFVVLLKNAYLVLTDSGGIQEEATALGKPTLVMREVTERMEAISSGTARLIGTTYDNIISNVENLLEDETEYQKMCVVNNPYGDGHAAERICQILWETFSE